MTENIEMVEFTSPRDGVRIVSHCGTHIAIFEAGQKRRLPKPLHDPALQAGLIPTKNMSEVQKILMETKEPDPKEALPYKDDEDKREKLIYAVEQVLGSNTKDAFTPTGKIRVAALKPLVEFSFTSREAQDAYSEALHRANIRGDQDKEPA